ncbi:MAG: AAA family ATPase [Gammaproteobacteria bacterium]|nr:AAA family ATPase [Gammaproteobacteria bacterium]
MTTTSESDALHEILAWSASRPMWQRDALRRLVTQDSLSDADIDELATICKGTEASASPLESKHIAAQTAQEHVVTLSAIKNATSVNALAERQSLSFAQTGISIIYGDNGSGKSGYVRVLKQCCRSRKIGDIDILPDVTATAPEPQSAEIHYTLGGQNRQFQWAPSNANSEILGAVSVFDSRTANVHVEKTNDVAYIPFPMKVLQDLVTLCNVVKDKLDHDISILKNQTSEAIKHPKCTAGTAVGQLFSKLSRNTKPDAVMALSDLSDEEKEAYRQLDTDFSQDPNVAARRLRQQATHLSEITDKAKNIIEAASNSSLLNFSNLFNDFNIKKDAARVAAEQLFSAATLPDIGGDLWRELWAAAERYSQEAAYKEKEFPAVDANDVCVLCQQTITDEAATRLKGFSAFIKNITKAAEDAAKKKLATKSTELREACLPHSEISEIVRFIRDDIDNADLAQLVKRLLVTAKRRVRVTLLGELSSTKATDIFPNDTFADCITNLNTRAATLLASKDSPEFQNLHFQYISLTDRLWIANIQDDIAAHISRLGSIYDLEKSRKQTASTAITSKNNELSEVLVTNALRGQFAREVTDLKIGRLAVELHKGKPKKGVAYYKVALIDRPDVKIGSILSEGEYRCVALAAFLAELITTSNKSGIVFDDPISSLDHRHRRAVARRLAIESLQRQVIIFTHDLAFLFELEREAQAAQSTIAYRHVLRKGSKPGHTSDQAPMKAQTASKRITKHQNFLYSIKTIYDNDPEGNWPTLARGLLNEIRQTWEQAISDLLKPVIGRFSNSISTKGLIKITVITDDDVTAMRASYRKISDMLHNASEELNPEAPTPSQIESELTVLRDWLDDILRRQNAIKGTETSFV